MTEAWRGPPALSGPRTYHSKLVFRATSVRQCSLTNMTLTKNVVHGTTLAWHEPKFCRLKVVPMIFSHFTTQTGQRGGGKPMKTFIGWLSSAVIKKNWCRIVNSRMKFNFIKNKLTMTSIKKIICLRSIGMFYNTVYSINSLILITVACTFFFLANTNDSCYISLTWKS